MADTNADSSRIPGLGALLGMDDLAPAQISRQCAKVKRMLDNQGLIPEFVAPRLWFASQTIDVDGGRSRGNCVGCGGFGVPPTSPNAVEHGGRK